MWKRNKSALAQVRDRWAYSRHAQERLSWRQRPPLGEEPPARVPKGWVMIEDRAQRERRPWRRAAGGSEWQL
jgi:hypothetical protein